METTQQEFWGQVISAAWENESFKKKLIANPVEAIEELTGKRIELSEGKTLVVRDQTDESTIYINIPAQQSLENVELNEAQLEAVAGGANAQSVLRPAIWDIIIIDPPTTFPTIK